MTWLVAFGLSALILLKLVTAFLTRRTKRKEANAYTSAGNLLTPAEQKFWLVLKQALPPGVMACPKVRLIDVLEPNKGDHAAKSRVLRKHLDFVLMDGMSSRILGAIELDDSSHDRPDRQERDRFVNAAMAFAGVPMLRIPTARNYDRDALADRLTAVLNEKSGRGARPSAKAPIPAAERS